MIHIEPSANAIAAAVWVILLTSIVSAAEPPTLVHALAGRYSKHFQNGLMDGETYWSDDVVEIVPISGKAAYFRASLAFANGNECDISGVAKVEDNQLVYRESPSQDYPPSAAGSLAAEHLCILRLSHAGSSLQLDDDQEGCRVRHCGMRGVLTWALPFNSKRSITYMPLLKASRNYAHALAEWGSDRSSR